MEKPNIIKITPTVTAVGKEKDTNRVLIVLGEGETPHAAVSLSVEEAGKLGVDLVNIASWLGASSEGFLSPDYQGEK